MNNPDETIKAGWSAEFTGRETWRDIGTFPTWWEAGMLLIDDEQGLTAEPVDDERLIDVGILRDPEPPENFILSDDILEMMREYEHDDYDLDVAEGWLANVSVEQKAELESFVRCAVYMWLTRHKLYPKWKVVGKSWTVSAGQIRERFRKEIAR